VKILAAVAGAHDIVTAGLASILGEDAGIELMDTFPAFGVVPDVVLYDAIGLEADDGVELYRLVKDLESPVVVVSRDLRPDLAARAMAHGAAGWVSIEADAHEVRQLIHAAARGRLDPQEDGSEAPALGAEAGLSRREVDVLSGVAKGLSNDDIAQLLGLANNTIKTYIRAAYRKIGVSTRSQAVAWCLQHGFEPPTRPPTP
jgi:DNA-binding NarL/FixJ family response regulator